METWASERSWIGSRWFRYPASALGLYASYLSFVMAMRIQARGGFDQVALAIDLSSAWAPVLFAFSLLLALQMAVASIMVLKAMEYLLLLVGPITPCHILLNTRLLDAQPTGWGWLFVFLCVLWIAGIVVIVWALSKTKRKPEGPEVVV